MEVLYARDTRFYLNHNLGLPKGCKPFNSALTAQWIWCTWRIYVLLTYYPDKQTTVWSSCTACCFLPPELNCCSLCCLMGNATLLSCSCMLLLQGGAALHAAFLPRRVFSSSRRCGCDVYGCRCRRHEAPLGRSVLGYRPRKGGPSVWRTP